jgi:glutathione S-transferase
MRPKPLIAAAGSMKTDGRITELHLWAVHEGLRRTPTTILFEDFCRRLIAAGVPLWRAFAGMRTLHPQWAGYTYTWWRDRNEINPARRSAILALSLLAVHPEGANHQWRRIPPRELSIDLEFAARNMCEGICVWVRELARPAGERSPTVLAHEVSRALRMADVFEGRAADPLKQGVPTMAHLTLAVALDVARKRGFGDLTDGRPQLAAWMRSMSELPSMQGRRDNTRRQSCGRSDGRLIAPSAFSPSAPTH